MIVHLLFLKQKPNITFKKATQEKKLTNNGSNNPYDKG